MAKAFRSQKLNFSWTEQTMWEYHEQSILWIAVTAITFMWNCSSYEQTAQDIGVAHTMCCQLCGQWSVHECCIAHREYRRFHTKYNAHDASHSYRQFEIPAFLHTFCQYLFAFVLVLLASDRFWRANYYFSLLN